MKLIELTDFFNRGNKEYVNPEQVARVENYEEEFATPEEYAATAGFGPWKKTVTKTRYVGINMRKGSKIVMKNGTDNTVVLESPTDVARLIQGE